MNKSELLFFIILLLVIIIIGKIAMYFGNPLLQQQKCYSFLGTRIVENKDTKNCLKKLEK